MNWSLTRKSGSWFTLQFQACMVGSVCYLSFAFFLALNYCYSNISLANICWISTVCHWEGKDNFLKGRGRDGRGYITSCFSRSSFPTTFALPHARHPSQLPHLPTSSSKGLIDCSFQITWPCSSFSDKMLRKAGDLILLWNITTFHSFV